jgi:hypothetical protein
MVWQQWSGLPFQIDTEKVGLAEVIFVVPEKSVLTKFTWRARPVSRNLVKTPACGNFKLFAGL